MVAATFDGRTAKLTSGFDFQHGVSYLVRKCIVLSWGHGQTDRQTDRRTDGRTDGRTDDSIV